MSGIADGILITVVLTNLTLLGSSRLMFSIRTVAVQGIVLGFLPIVVAHAGVTAHVLLLGFGSMALKGLMFPWLLGRALRGAEVRREVEPYMGYVSSLLIGTVLLVTSLWLGDRLPLPTELASWLVVPGAFFTMFIGLFLIVSRKKALHQVLGYLVLENGIFVFGVSVVREAPFLIEFGILLDVFVAVFVMGIAMFHINRAFDHIDTDRLSTLKG